MCHDGASVDQGPGGVADPNDRRVEQERISEHRTTIHRCVDAATTPAGCGSLAAREHTGAATTARHDHPAPAAPARVGHCAIADNRTRRTALCRIAPARHAAPTRR